MLRAVEDAGYTALRPIQAVALPAALDGRDVLGLAPTGTGKTAAFVLPILQRLLDGRRGGPRALVVAPTRELAAQVHSEFEKLAAHTRLKSMAVFGGIPIARQIRGLRSRPDIIVACPGRLLDLLYQGALHFDSVEVLVLDEADHMFDMGFLPDLRRILRALPKERQNLLFSATMPKEIRGLADDVLDRPEVAELANSQPASTIDHALYPMDEAAKEKSLEGLINDADFRSAIVFLRTKHRAKRLALKLEKYGYPAVALQGNMSQPQRERAMQGFRSGKFKILVATDIAARGLDIAGISHVVNWDVPNTPDAYTHRIGRTGRSEQSGRAFTFVTADDRAAIRQIEKRLGGPIERRRLDGSVLPPAPKRGERSSQDERPARGGRPPAKQGGRKPGKKPGARRTPSQKGERKSGGGIPSEMIAGRSKSKPGPEGGSKPNRRSGRR